MKISPRSCLLLTLLVLGCSQASLLKSLGHAQAKDPYEDYITALMFDGGFISKGMIIRITNGEYRAHTEGFDLKEGEAAPILKFFNDPNADPFPSFFIAGVKYIKINSSYEAIYGRRGSTGIIIERSIKHILIGFYDESKSKIAGNAAKAVKILADILTGEGN